jgi:septum formation protein
MGRSLILASASPRRAELLKQLGLEFTIIASHFPEDPPGPTDLPGEYVARLARFKAERVAQSIDAGVVIGADTVVVLEDEILGKPVGADEAIMMLSRLSGKEHSVYTGVALFERPGGQSRVLVEETRVRFRKLTRGEIEAYVATGEPLDKAGAYGIQGKGAILVDSISGCYFNVVGLPIGRLAMVLPQFGVSVW